MICKVYSVLLVICITCLLIFTNLDQTNNQFYFLPLSGQVSKYGSLNYIVADNNLSNTSQSSSAAVAYKDMENNNTRIEDMDSANDVKAKMHSPAKESAGGDMVDGKYVGQFNIKMLNEHLKKCIREKDQQVDMDEYIYIFQQLYKCVVLSGTRNLLYCGNFSYAK